MMTAGGPCYAECNKIYDWDDVTGRLFCKKGCDAEEEGYQKCYDEFCDDLCVKKRIGMEGQEFGAWSKYLDRASGNTEECFSYCANGCKNREEDDEGGDGGDKEGDDAGKEGSEAPKEEAKE